MSRTKVAKDVILDLFALCFENFDLVVAFLNDRRFLLHYSLNHRNR